jgi:Carboxypeptidase regulatory-like domain
LKGAPSGHIVGIMRIFLVVVLLCVPAIGSAQSAASAPRLGTIRGTVYDSLGRSALVGATVELASPARTVTTDKRGTFTIDSVPPGANRLTFSAPVLDSIGLFGFAREFEVRAGDQRITLATPSFGTLHARLCAPTDVAARDSAIMFGTVYDARTRSPVKQATVTFGWYAVDVTAGPQLVEVRRDAMADDAGNYGRCGLPDDMALRTYASTAAAVSGTISNVIGSARVMRRDLFISEEMKGDTTSAPSAGSASAPPAAAAPATRGSGVVRGTVRDERGGPLLNALVVLLSSDRTTRTDSLGQYRFAAVPLGTQELSVRQVGRGALYRTIDVTADGPVEESFVLPTTTVLATMNVRGERRLGSDQTEFLQRKRVGFGRYLDQAEISRRFDTPAALQRIPGLRVLRSFGGINVMNQRTGCEPLIVIDGVPNSMRNSSSTIPLPGAAAAPTPSMPEMRIETLSVRDVFAIEYYPGLSGMPMKYATGDAPRCGMLLIWTVFSRW